MTQILLLIWVVAPTVYRPIEVLHTNAFGTEEPRVTYTSLYSVPNHVSWRNVVELHFLHVLLLPAVTHYT